MRINLGYQLEDVKSEFEPLPRGTYEATITECTLAKSSTNKDMLKFTWTVNDGEYAGRKLFDNVVLDVGWKVKQYAEAAGIASGAELDTEDFKGATAILTVDFAPKQNPDDETEPIRNAIKRIVPASR